MEDYPGPVDDMIVFALSATLNNNQIFVDNTHYYGVSLKINIFTHIMSCFQVIMLPLEEGQLLSADLPNLQNTLLEATVKGTVIQVGRHCDHSSYMICSGSARSAAVSATIASKVQAWL